MSKRDEKLKKTLRKVMMRMRWDGQDGFPGVGPSGLYAGYAGFLTSGLAGIGAGVPDSDAIVRRGTRASTTSPSRRT